MAEEQSKRGARIKRVGKFGIVGGLNTLLDFLIYNVLSSEFGLALIPANIVSTTIAMVFSFVANKKLVFEKHHGSITRQVISFYLVTAFGLYVLQTAVISLFTNVWLWPVHTGLLLFHMAGVQGHDQFLVKNSAKAAATVVSMTWNYIMYKKVVFK